MEDYADRYGVRFVKLIDSRATLREFEFDQALLMPTAEGYRALVEQADKEIKPRIKKYLQRNLSEGAIENLSFFAMAVAVYARSIADPPYTIDIGKVLLRTVAFCNRRCVHREGTGGGCRVAMNSGQHYLPKCVKLPRDIALVWGSVKRYIAAGGTISRQEATKVKVDPGFDYAPATSC